MKKTMIMIFLILHIKFAEDVIRKNLFGPVHLC